MFSDPKYSFPVCQKFFFLIQSKVNIFHQIQPRYATLTLAGDGEGAHGAAGSGCLGVCAGAGEA